MQKFLFCPILLFIAFTIIYGNDIKTVSSSYVGNWYLDKSCGGFTGGCRYPGINDSTKLVVFLDSTNYGTLTAPVIVFNFYKKNTLAEFGTVDSISPDTFRVFKSDSPYVSHTYHYLVLELHESSGIHPYDVSAVGNLLTIGTEANDNVAYSYNKITEINTIVNNPVRKFNKNNTATNNHLYTLNGRQLNISILDRKSLKLSKYQYLLKH